jgi:uncharacterized membrane protein YphA (DoxX/SURF4 family)
MKHRNTRVIDRMGLTLIRIIIASYFLAVSINLVEGTHPSLLFSHMSDPEAANILGSFLLFMGAYLLLCGLAVRLVSIYLVLLLLGSSIMQNIVLVNAIQVDNFWRDLVLVSALILGYGTLTRRELQRAAFVRRKYKVRKALNRGEFRAHRTENSQTQIKTANPGDQPRARPKAIRPLASQPVVIKSQESCGLDFLSDDMEDDEVNIFAT